MKMHLTKVLAAVLACLLTTAVFAGDWPQFLGPARNNVSEEKNLLNAFPKDGPKELWTATLGEGFGGAAVQGGKVYLLDRDGDNDVLRCWDLASGKEDWTYKYDAPGKKQYPGSRSTPAVDDKYVYIVSPFGLFQCVDKKTHDRVWKADLLLDFDGKTPNWAISQSALLYKDSVIVAPRGPDAGVVAYEKATGKVLWKSKPLAEGKNQMCYDSPMLATVGGQDMIATMAAIPNPNPRAMPAACNVVGIDPKDGTILWSYNKWGVAWPIPGAANLGEGRILLSGEYGAGMALIQIKKSDDEKEKYKVEEIFHNRGMGQVASQVHQPLLVKDHVYFVSSGFDRGDGVVCMDLTGKVIWKTGKPVDESGKTKPTPNQLGATLLADGKIFLLDGETGDLRIIQPSPDGYKELSSAKVVSKGNMWAPMALSDGKLLVRDQGVLKCLDVSAGKDTPATAPAERL